MKVNLFSPIPDFSLCICGLSFPLHSLICVPWPVMGLCSVSLTLSQVRYDDMWLVVFQKLRFLSEPHKPAGPLLPHYTAFLFFPLPSLSIFSSPAGQGSPAAARAHSSLPTFSSTCSCLAALSGILKAWSRAICCLALHHFTPDPWSLCMLPHFSFLSQFQTKQRGWKTESVLKRINPAVTIHLTENKAVQVKPNRCCSICSGGANW